MLIALTWFSIVINYRFLIAVRGCARLQCQSRPESSGSSSGYGITEDVIDFHSTQRLAADVSEANRYDIPRWPPTRIQNAMDSYDVPRPMHAIEPVSPCSSDSSLMLSANDSRCSSNRSSFAPDYDVPRPRPVTPEKLLESKLMVCFQNTEVCFSRTML